MFKSEQNRRRSADRALGRRINVLESLLGVREPNMSSDSQRDNGRVTLAVLKQAVEALTAEVKEGFRGFSTRMDKVQSSVHSMDTRLSVVENRQEEIMKPGLGRAEETREQVQENRIEIAKAVAKWGAISAAGGGLIGFIADRLIDLMSAGTPPIP